jgi:hypothetical protein
MIPFFVVDRPISLKIIGGLKIPRGQKIGLMAHANTSPNFRKAFREHPRRRVVKMCDSAIFNRGGCRTGYKELFETYESMHTDYGVIIDVFRNKSATLKSAKEALAKYRAGHYTFKLVAVAQGKTVGQYLDCYRQLRRMGYRYIAIGGLLEKRERTARYTNVRSEKLLIKVLKQAREEFSPEWLFALGCLHPSRLKLFKELDVWGDYKGWIFEYDKRDESMRKTIAQLSRNHLRHAPLRFRQSALGVEVASVLIKRQRALRSRTAAHEASLSSKRALKDLLGRLSTQSHGKHRTLAKVIEPLKSRGLLDDTEEGRLLDNLRRADISKYKQQKLLHLCEESRAQKADLVKADRKLEACNQKLLLVLRRVIKSRSTDTELRQTASRIIAVLRTTEQKHRIGQVRTYIQKEILNPLG